MRFVFDQDYHIHSELSECSSDPAQSPKAILEYAKKNGLRDLVLTDHFWDSPTVPGASKWYLPQDLPHIRQSLPLPKDDAVRFRFGCETDLDKHLTLGIGPEAMRELAFLVIPTTHLHMMGFTLDPEDDTVEGRAALYVRRLDAVLDMDLPFKKVGIAHLTCSLLAPGPWEYHLAVLDAIPDETYRRLYGKLRDRGAGFELNFTISAYQGRDLDRVLRPFRIARDLGCKFYCGSDAHHPDELAAAPQKFNDIIDALELTEDMKFHIGE